MVERGESMELEVVATEKAPKAVGPYVQGVKAHGFLFTAGQIGLDPATGLIIDPRHPQAGESVTDKVLAIPALRGSSGSAGSLAEAFKNGHGPAALVLGQADTAPIAAALVVQHLYGRQIPILEVPPEELKILKSGAWISIDAAGGIETAA